MDLGPVRGLLVIAEDEIFHRFKKLKHRMPTNMIILQAIVISFWDLIYVVLPGEVNSSFWILFS